MVIYVNLCKLGCLVVFKSQWNDFHGVKNLSIDTKNTSVGDLVEKLEHFIFLASNMLIYVNLCKLGCPVVFKSWWNDFHGVKNLSIDTKNTSVGDLVEKLKDFLFFGLNMLICVNLCKLSCLVVVKS